MSLNIDNIPWAGPFPARGKYFRVAPMTDELWDGWHDDKSYLKSRGIQVYKDKNDEWQMALWTDSEALPGHAPLPSESFPELPELPPIETSCGAVSLLPPQIPHVQNHVRSLRAFNCAIDASQTGTGKCHAKGEKILMFDGSIKKVEEILEGEELMGPDSKPRKVLSLSHGIDELYRITPVKGEPFTVNKAHIIPFKLTGVPQGFVFNGKRHYPGEIIDIALCDYLKLTKSQRHVLKLWRTGVDFPDNEEKYIIPPYIAGIYLGDGSVLGQPCITNPEKPVLDEWIAWIHSMGWRARTEIVEGKCIQVYAAPLKPNGNWGKNGSEYDTSIFKNTGIKTEGRYIPKEYLIASREVRLEILAGLMDTDGYKNPGNGYEISCKSRRLKDDILFLARSLGYAAYSSSAYKRCVNTNAWGYYHRIFISGDVDEIPVRLKRKKCSPRRQKKNVLVTGVRKVEPLGEGEYYGFTITGDRRYLMADFTVTHNTVSALMTAHNLGLTPVVLCPKVVISSWQEWGRKMGIDVHVTNYEQAIRGNWPYIEKTNKSRPAYMKFEWKFRNPERYLVILDEAHRLKGEETLTACLAGSLKRSGVKALVLSATLCETPLDLKNVGYLMGFHCWSNWQDFLKSNGCFQTSFTVQKNIRLKNGARFKKDIQVKKWIYKGGKAGLAKLHTKIFPAMGARLTVQDMKGHFPDNHIIPMQIAIGGVEKVYEAMRKELRELEMKKKRDEFASDSKLTILLRAQQEAELLKVPSIIEMAKDLEEEGNSVVIFTQFRESLGAIHKALGGGTINGDQKGTQRDEAIARFQSDKDHFMSVQIQAGGAGVSLHQDKDGMRPRVSLLVPIFDGRMLQQALGRIHRAGTRDATKQYIIFDSKSKSDCRACKAIEKKIANMEAFNGSEVEDLVIIED